MSRIGKTIRVLPAGVTAEIKGTDFVVKGPKGQLTINIHPRVTLSIKDGQITTSVVSENNTKDRALWGTFSSLVENMIDGVTVGFKKQLEVNGVGFKVSMKGTDLHFDLGYTNPIDFKAPAGIKFAVEKNLVTVEGTDKHLVGQTAASIRELRKPEPYKGKGIKYIDEVIRRKAGKAAAKAAA